MTGVHTIDSVPAAGTPPGGWTEWPGPVLAGGAEPLVPGAGVHVAAVDLTTEVHVVATDDDGVHVLRPEGLPIEVGRWREAEHPMWDDASFVARMRRLADAERDPVMVLASTKRTEQ